MIVRFLASAQADLDAIYLKVAMHDPDAADRLIDRLKRSTWRLRDFPHSAPARPEVAPDARGLSVAGHIMLHRVTSADVEIVRVAHARQDLSLIEF